MKIKKNEKCLFYYIYPSFFKKIYINLKKYSLSPHKDGYKMKDKRTGKYL